MKLRKLRKLCKTLGQISEEEFEKEWQELHSIAKKQVEYIHPLKHATAKQQEKLGQHNLKVLDLLKKLYSRLIIDPR